MIAMCTCISFAIDKGGTGKTTSTGNVAACLAKMGKKVLMIDLDHQADLSDWYGQDVTTQYHVGRMLLGELSFQEILVNISDNLDLIPSSKENDKIEKLLVAERGAEGRLKRNIEKNGLREMYDYILMDCPKGLGNFTTNGVVASDFYIVPVKPEYFDYKGIEFFQKHIQEIIDSGLNDHLQLLGILITRYNLNQKNNVKKATAEKIRESALPVFETIIRDNSPLIEAVINGCSIFEQNPHSNGAKDYQSLTKEILALTS